MKNYKTFTKFLESSKNDDEFSFVGFFDDADDALKTASILLNNDESRHLSMVIEKIDDILDYINGHSSLLSDDDRTQLKTRTMAVQTFYDLQNEIIFIDDWTGWMPDKKIIRLEQIQIVARHKRIVILLIVNPHGNEKRLFPISHLCVFNRNGESLISSYHKHFFTNGDCVKVW